MTATPAAIPVTMQWPFPLTHKTVWPRLGAYLVGVTLFVGQIVEASTAGEPDLHRSLVWGYLVAVLGLIVIVQGVAIYEEVLLGRAAKRLREQGINVTAGRLRELTTGKRDTLHIEVDFRVVATLRLSPGVRGSRRYILVED